MNDSIQRIHKAGGATGTALKEKKINCMDSLQNIFNFDFDERIDLTKNKARKVKGAAGTKENGPRRMHQEECTKKKCIKKNGPRRIDQEECTKKNQEKCTKKNGPRRLHQEDWTKKNAPRRLHVDEWTKKNAPRKMHEEECTKKNQEK